MKALVTEKYEARWDAETLMHAEEIKADKKRYDAAIKASQELVKEKEEAAAAAEKIAKQGPKGSQWRKKG